MGKQARLNAARRAAEQATGAVATVARPAPLPPRPAIEPWAIDKDLRVTPTRRAMFARPLPRKRVACDLCFKQCEIGPGESGWCGYRRNDNGQMAIPEHGLLARSQRLILGYQGGIHTFLPGAPALGVGATRCTARCSFCTSANVVWAPEQIAWLTHEQGPGTDADLYYRAKGYFHPEAVLANAQDRQAKAIVFAENEPTLSYEYTYDVARLAKSAGLKTIIYTNGFTSPAAIRKLAPHIDAVDVGIKGSLDETFYVTRMRSPGGPGAVRRALQEWRAAGVGHLLISDLIATRFMQSDDAQEAASAALYAWIVAHLGPHTPVMLGHLHPPDGQHSQQQYLLPDRLEELLLYRDRIAATHARAQAAGLAYAHESNTDDRINCHNCGGLLLERHAPATPDGSTCPYELIGSTEDRCVMYQTYCNCWSHTQHVTDSRCDHCGATVPIVTLPAAELAAFRATIPAPAID